MHDRVALFIPIGTFLLAISFAYASTLSEIFDSMHMLFMMKPFEIGDIITGKHGNTACVSLNVVVCSGRRPPDDCGARRRIDHVSL